MKLLWLIPAMCLVVILGLGACGVKGPPLPPVPDTAEQSDAVDRNSPSPKPSPSPRQDR